MNKKGFRPNVDLVQSFEKLITSSFGTINGYTVQRLPNMMFKCEVSGFVGTYEEVAQHIRDQGAALQKSIERGKEAIKK